MSKTSRPRPYSVPLEDFDNSYDTIFGKKPPKERYVPPPLVLDDTPKQTITFDNTVYDNERLVSKFDKQELQNQDKSIDK